MLHQESKFIFLIGIILLAFIALLGFIFFVIFKNIKIRKEKELEIRDAIIDTQNNEQNRIAEDLHDELAPTLSAIKLQLNNMKQLSEANQSAVELCSHHLDKSIENIRLIARSLSGKMIINNGLIPSIEDSFGLFTKQNKIKFATRFNIDERIVSDHIKNNVYKILMELVNNSIRHSNSSMISIVIIQENHGIRFQYFDNGKTEKSTSLTKGAGTINITNRLNLIHAKINKFSRDFSSGAEFDFDIPLSK
jgi:signal transduction histidine kinase